MKNPVLSNNAFVKAEQMRMKAMMGDKPAMPAAMEKFDAYMSNDGARAQESARKLCRDLDPCFPLK